MFKLNGNLENYILFILFADNNVPVSHRSPVYPCWHVHSYWLTPSEQFPPFKQGELAHSSIPVTRRYLYCVQYI